MKINLKDLIEILLAAIAIGTLIYRMSEARAVLERRIDLLERKLDFHITKVEGIEELVQRIREFRAELERKIDSLKHELDVHVAKVEGKDEFSDYIVHGLDEKIDHKFQRLWDIVREIQQFLEKNLEYTIRKH